VADLFDLDSSAVLPGARLREDLGLDSLNVVELELALEESFGLGDTHLNGNDWVSVVDVTDVVAALVGA
jgi:acyl carrier protein